MTDIGEIDGGWYADTRLVGRAALLAEVVDCVLTGHRSGVLLVGPLGVGTSRLAREVVDIAERAGFVTVSLAAVGGAGDRPSIVVVDDVHVAGAPTAATIQRLVSADGVRFVLTATSRRRPPDAITMLWKDGHLARFDVRPLDRAASDLLVTEVLDGPVQRRTLELLWTQAAGNPGRLRSVLRAARADGVLVVDDHAWTWAGAPPPDGRLARLVDASLAPLSPPARRAAELVALAAPVAFGAVEAVVGPSALVEAESHGAITVGHGERPLVLESGSWLIGEVLRSRLDRETTAAHFADLAGNIGESSTERTRFTVRRFQASGGGDLDDLLVASRHVLPDDVPLAEQLARAAHRTRPSVDTALALATSLDAQHRPGDADAVLSEWWHAALDVLPAPGAVSFVIERVLVLVRGLGRADAAAGCVAEARRAADAQDWHVLLDAVWAHALSYVDVEAAARLAGPLLADDVEPRVRVHAVHGVVAAQLAEGRSDDALGAIESVVGDAIGSGSRFPQTAASVLALRKAAVGIAGRVDELRAMTELDLQDVDGDQPAAGAALVGRAEAAILAGDVRLADEQVTRGLDHLERFDPSTVRPRAWSLAASARGMRGDAPGAAAAAEIVRSFAHHRRALVSYAAELTEAEVWELAAAGDVDAARRRALAGLATTGLGVDRASLAVLAVRLGSRDAAAADTVAEVAAAAQSALVSAHAQFVAAVCEGSAAGLAMAADHYRRLGVRLLEAEALVLAAEAHRELGDEPDARRCAAMSAAALARCGDAATPIVRRLVAPELTERERSIGLAAAEGHTNLEIAELLGRSVRTVEWHLRQVYHKLGVSGRADLADVFGLG